MLLLWMDRNESSDLSTNASATACAPVKIRKVWKHQNICNSWHTTTTSTRSTTISSSTTTSTRSTTISSSTTTSTRITSSSTSSTSNTSTSSTSSSTSSIMCTMSTSSITVELASCQTVSQKLRVGDQSKLNNFSG